MKLNNKGFAFSTMLYGTLALITVILYVILGINQGSNDETLFYGEEIQQKLNECVYEEVQLENCYSSHVGTCDPTSYHACLGISDYVDNNMGEIMAETLKTKTGVYQDNLVERRYVYRGANVNNYIRFSNKIWRIISIEPDDSIRLIDYTHNENRIWDATTSVWGSSTLKEYLNNNYLPEIADSTKLISGKWSAVIIEPVNNAYSAQDYKTYEEDNDSDIASYAMVGLPSIYDYMNATTAEACRTNMLANRDCSSWLSNYKSWTINKANVTTNNKAYSMPFTVTTNNNVTTYNNFKINDITTANGIYPIIVLNRNNFIKSGSGTVSDPYVLR